ncbi:MAG: glyoxylase family protein [Alphaproteobacteria bacterium]|jgi:catechol 2,3-dioxygenase-like lactoylglutathione lyase family enzyme|nr:glyoxylase family protein [Alphaproteobacteria bacterium]
MTGEKQMLKTEGVLHFTIPVKDLDRSERFYTEILGMEKLRRNNHMVFMRAGGACFVLTYSENEINPNRGDAHDIHHAFTVSAEEYDRAKTFLPTQGVPIFKEEDRQHGTFRGRSAYFHDPDRNVIEIMDLVAGPISEADEKT